MSMLESGSNRSSLYLKELGKWKFQANAEDAECEYRNTYVLQVPQFSSLYKYALLQLQKYTP